MNGLKHECQDCGEIVGRLFEWDDMNPYGDPIHLVCQDCYSIRDNAEPSDDEIYGATSAAERDEQSQRDYLELK